MIYCLKFEKCFLINQQSSILYGFARIRRVLDVVMDLAEVAETAGFSAGASATGRVVPAHGRRLK